MCGSFIVITFKCLIKILEEFTKLSLCYSIVYYYNGAFRHYLNYNLLATKQVRHISAVAVAYRHTYIIIIIITCIIIIISVRTKCTNM